MIVNTIDCVSYNEKQRKHLDDLLRAAKARRQSVLDMWGDIDEDDDSLDAEMESTEKEVHQAWLDCFAAQFHKCGNSWFASAIEKFADGRTHQISEKQYFCFSKYACDEDRESWRTHSKYCRCGNSLVTLTWKNANRSIKVEPVNA